MNRKPGDWDCRACQHLNFRSRESCHLCGEPKLGTGMGMENGSLSGGRNSGADIAKPGDWYCICGVRNFACRSNCFKCGAIKHEEYSVTVAATESNMLQARLFGFSGHTAGWKSGDWICIRPGCNEHNFASRMECFRCKAPRAYDNSYAGEY